MLVILGGYNGTEMTSVEVIDLIDFTKDCIVSDLPGEIRDFEAVTVDDEVVYCGGWDGFTAR